VTAMDDLLTRVRGVLSTTPGRWLALAESVPAGPLAARPAEGEWSAVECLHHLVDTEQAVYPVRIDAFRRGAEFPQHPSARDLRVGRTDEPRALAAYFADLREDTLQLLGTVDEDELGLIGRHPRLGEVTLGTFLVQWAAHDLMHTVQAERALMQPFIRESGPWRPEFADHDAGDATG
jgi:hypothetical protein